jgi:hypothetical protein
MATYVRRREFVVTIGSAAAAWPLAARGQQPSQVRRIGILMPYPNSDAESQSYVRAFRQELARLGWSEGGKVQFDERWSTSNMDLVKADAANLVALNPDVIVIVGDRVIPILTKLTRSIPIVVALTSDPIASGAVESLARPGRNVTGFSLIEFSIFGKMLEAAPAPCTVNRPPCTNSDLFLMNSDGTADGGEFPTPLTRRVGADAVGGSSASFDPTGKNIAFHRSASGTYGTRLQGRTEPGGPTTDSDIFLVNLDDLLENGKEPTNLTNGLPSQQTPGCECRFASDDPDWSPDGKLIAFTSRIPDSSGVPIPSSRGIYVMKLMTGEVTKLTNLNNDVAEERSPAWSPDGTRIAIMRRPAPGQPFEIWVLYLSVDSSTETITVGSDTRLTFNNFPDLAPAWSSTGEEILFHTARPSPTGTPSQQTNNQIWVIPAKGCPTPEPCEKALTGTDLSAPPGALLGQNFFPKWGRIAVGQDPAPE